MGNDEALFLFNLERGIYSANIVAGHSSVALHLTVVKPKGYFFSASQVTDLAILGRKRQSRIGFEPTTV